MGATLFRKEALQKYHEVERGGIALVAPPSRLALVVSFAVVVVAALAFALLQRVRVGAVGRGTVEPDVPAASARVRVAGVVSRVAAVPGAVVHAGDVLIELAAERAEATEPEPAPTRPAVDGASEDASTRALREVLERQLLEAGAARRAEIEDARERRRVRAPIDGTIGAIRPVVGDVVSAGDIVAKVLPHGSRLVGVVAVPVRYRRLVKPGQHARLQLDEYPFEEAGLADGHVVRIRDDARDDTAHAPAEPMTYVEVSLEAMPPHAKGERFREGMQFTGEITVRKQRVAVVVMPALAQIWDD